MKENNKHTNHMCCLMYFESVATEETSGEALFRASENIVRFQFLSLNPPHLHLFLSFPYNLSLHGSVQFSRSGMSNSLRLHKLQHARPPCPSPTPEVHPNSCPLSWWCHPTISSSVIPFSACSQSFPDQGLFKWASSLHQVAKVFGFQLQHSSFQWTPRTDLL